MSDSKRQSLIMAGLAMMLFSVVLLYFAMSQPEISDEAVYETAQTTPSTEQIKSSEENGDLPSEEVSRFENESATSSAAGKVFETENSVKTQGVKEDKINLNTCTIDELVTLDGVGEAKADAIIQYREYVGGYKSVDEIKNIKGIGDNIYNKIADKLTV